MFPPDIGGPGAYAEHLASECAARGLSVSILCYGKKGTPGGSFRVRRISRDIPSGLKHLWFAFRAWQMLGRSDVVLVFDPVIVGAPIVLARSFRRRPMFVRIEGDFLWEWFCERTHEEQTLRKFYETLLPSRLSRKERIMYWVYGWVISRADALVFSSKWRETIFNIGYPLPKGRRFLILPAVPEPRSTSAKREQVFRFIGRFVRVKNIPRLIRTFLDVAGPEWRLELIGEGPMQGEVEKIIRDAGAQERITVIPSLGKEAISHKIASAHAVLLPSISDVSPNVILECIAVKTPFLLTEETGFRDMLGDMVPWVDPLDEADLRVKLKLLLQPDSYVRYKEHLETLRARSWSAVTDDWLKLLTTYT
jgi:glycosyltransferase involved in cell wall biosynthesis